MPTKHTKNTPLVGTGWLVGLRSMSADLTPSKSKGSEVGKNYSPTHQPPKIKTKTKTKVKTITSTGAAKGAGQTRLRYRSSKRRGLNQPAAKTTGETEHVKPALARGRQAVYVGPILRRPLTGTRRPEGNEQPKGPDGATSRPPAVQSRGVYSSCGLTSAWP